MGAFRQDSGSPILEAAPSLDEAAAQTACAFRLVVVPIAQMVADDVEPFRIKGFEPAPQEDIPYGMAMEERAYDREPDRFARYAGARGRGARPSRIPGGHRAGGEGAEGSLEFPIVASLVGEEERERRADALGVASDALRIAGIECVRETLDAAPIGFATAGCRLVVGIEGRYLEHACKEARSDGPRVEFQDPRAGGPGFPDHPQPGPDAGRFEQNGRIVGTERDCPGREGIRQGRACGADLQAELIPGQVQVPGRFLTSIRFHAGFRSRYDPFASPSGTARSGHGRRSGVCIAKGAILVTELTESAFRALDAEFAQFRGLPFTFGIRGLVHVLVPPFHTHPFRSPDRKPGACNCGNTRWRLKRKASGRSFAHRFFYRRSS